VVAGATLPAAARSERESQAHTPRLGAVHFGTLVDKATRFTLGKALPWKSDAAQFVHDGLKRLQLQAIVDKLGIVASWPLPLGRRKGADDANPNDLPASARDRDYNHDSALTVQKPRSRRQEPCHLQHGADSADSERD
jgi:hypothetical protein